MNDDLTPFDASDPTTSDDATNAAADGAASGADDVSAAGDVSADVAAVSALVDSVATPAQMAVVESSPELRTLLATMTANRGHLAPIVAPTESRESAVTAALAAFDARTPTMVAAGAGIDTATAPNVVRLERRRGQYRLAMGAAAAVAVLFVGAAATGWLGRGDDDSSTAAQRQSEAPALDLQAAAETVAGGDTAAPSPAVTESAAEGDVSPAAAASEEAVEAGAVDSFDASDEREPVDETGAPAAAPAATIGSIDDGAGVDVDRIDSPAALAVYALDRPRLIAGDDGISCITDDAADVELLGTIIYDGTDAVVVRNSASGVVSARDLTTCAVIVSITP